jgi:hypothetical protein
MDETTVANDNPARLTMGAIIASAAVAALVAFFLRRAMRAQEEEEAEISPAALKDRATAATGEFVRSYLAPEMKPMLITVIKDVREYIDRGFQRAEQSIREF